ncbi:MAG: hypothetical protein CVU50_00015 [Candidatus Cloacimonetes bacterium HGW-Cloacimonetes-3]|nr:MAG: hypothetical protein CVU50_00015 [Candidatus Cloacimonetes bacterium HGW-Cloacimonetes-3]
MTNKLRISNLHNMYNNGGRMKRLIIICMLVAAIGSVFAERKALVIANSMYGKVLVNSAIADADSMEAALRTLEFSVLRHNNLRLSSITAAVDSFAQGISSSDEVVVYYSGHGTNASGVNYIVPSGVDLGNTQVYSKTAYSLSTLAQKLKLAKRSLIILEASRSWGLSGSKAVSKPFVAMIPVSAKQVIVSAAQPSSVVQLSLGTHSTFTQSLIERISTSEEGFNSIFPLVVSDVMARTGKLQQPWATGAFDGDFYFITTEMKLRWRNNYFEQGVDGGGSLSW